MKKPLTILPLFLLLLGAGPEKRTDLVLIVSSADPRSQAAVAGFRSAYAGEFREIDLEGSDKKVKTFGEELQTKKPDLAVAVGDLAVQMAKWYLAGVPVVYGDSPRAAKIGLEPGKAIGISSLSDPGEQLKLIAQLFKNRKRVGLFYGKDYTPLPADKLAQEARELGLTLLLNPMGSVQEVPGKLREVMPQADLLWVLTDPVVISQYSIEYIVLQSVTAGVPIFCGDSVLAQSGATAALVPDPMDVGVKAAREAEAVARQGQAAGGALIYPKGSLVLNAKLGTFLKIAFPPEVVRQASKVIQ